MQNVEGLEDFVKQFYPKLNHDESLLYMEFVLHGLAEYSRLSKNELVQGSRFKDLFSSFIDPNRFIADDDEGMEGLN